MEEEKQVRAATQHLMNIVGQSGEAYTATNVAEALRRAAEEIMTLRAERTRKRLDEEDELFTIEDAQLAASFPALPMLQRMAATYRERRGSYGPSEQRFADIMVALFPDGLTLKVRSDWVRYGLFHQIVGKLSRYVRDFSEPHIDSIHDIGPYSAMLEAEDRRTMHRPPFNFRLPEDDHTG